VPRSVPTGAGKRAEACPAHEPGKVAILPFLGEPAAQAFVAARLRLGQGVPVAAGNLYSALSCPFYVVTPACNSARRCATRAVPAGDPG